MCRSLHARLSLYLPMVGVLLVALVLARSALIAALSLPVTLAQAQALGGW